MKFYFQVLSIFILMALVACGSNSEQKQTSNQEKAANDVFEVEVTGNDQMQYNVKTIEVPAGKTIRVTLKHVGQMPKETMGHNFIILKQGIDMAAFAAKAINAKETDYVPADEEKNIIAHTKMIGGGESTSIEFKAPAAGTYKFLCSFPGHYALMQGDFIVK